MSVHAINAGIALRSGISAAHHAFERAYAGGFWPGLGRLWRRQSGQLLNLSEMKKDRVVASSRFLGAKLVPIAQIAGSEGRSGEFTADFRPLKRHTADRWIGVMGAWQAGKLLPPVVLLLINGRYFVRDGHHRISVAHYFGQTHVEAMVTEWVLDTAVAVARPQLQGDWRLLDRMQCG